jgi:hypothetical protein
MAGSALSVSRGILRAGALAASLLSAVLAASPALATTFTVTNTADTGANSLRDALTLAQNCTGGPHTIAFNVPGGSLTGGVAVITLASTLPSVTCAGTTIDGTTQTANGGNTNNVTLGTGGTVGTGPDGRAGTGDELTLPQLNGPEVEIVGSSLEGSILVLQAATSPFVASPCTEAGTSPVPARAAETSTSRAGRES